MAREVVSEEAWGWQPIDTAPRDGTQFLAAFREPSSYLVSLVRWDPCWTMGPTFPQPPQFWMPLPKPPSPSETIE
jgi:hypothetical protein